MSTTVHIAAAAVISAAALAFIAGPAGAGERPLHHTIELDRRQVFASPCGFPIEEHLTGTERITVHFDAEGHPVRARFGGSNIRLAFTNLDNGKSVESVLASTAHVRYEETGASTIRISGLHGHLVVPGQGVVEQESGLVLLVRVSPSDPPTVEQLSGRFDGQPGPFPELCDVLGGGAGAAEAER